MHRKAVRSRSLSCWEQTLRQLGLCAQAQSSLGGCFKKNTHIYRWWNDNHQMHTTRTQLQPGHLATADPVSHNCSVPNYWKPILYCHLVSVPIKQDSDVGLGYSTSIFFCTPITHHVHILASVISEEWDLRKRVARGPPHLSTAFTPISIPLSKARSAPISACGLMSVSVCVCVCVQMSSKNHENLFKWRSSAYPWKFSPGAPSHVIELRTKPERSPAQR